jgi:hypothetical protein
MEEGIKEANIPLAILFALAAGFSISSAIVHYRIMKK